jgi:hypothetical protein
MEAAVRGTEEKKEVPKAEKKEESEKSKEMAKAQKRKEEQK